MKKIIRHAVVALALSAGLVGVAQAHVFVGIGMGFAAPVVPVVPVVTAPPVVTTYAPPVYYAPPPPPPVYAAPAVVGYYGPRPWYPAYYGGWGYWRR